MDDGVLCPPQAGDDQEALYDFSFSPASVEARGPQTVEEKSEEPGDLGVLVLLGRPELDALCRSVRSPQPGSWGEFFRLFSSSHRNKVSGCCLFDNLSATATKKETTFTTHPPFSFRSGFLLPGRQCDTGPCGDCRCLRTPARRDPGAAQGGWSRGRRWVSRSGSAVLCLGFCDPDCGLLSSFWAVLW